MEGQLCELLSKKHSKIQTVNKMLFLEVNLMLFLRIFTSDSTSGIALLHFVLNYLSLSAR